MTRADIYLDNNATTPCDPRVLEAMLPFFGQVYGNPANGLHKQGRLAAQGVEEARERVASLLGAAPAEIVFTAGATESNNLAIQGIARAAARHGRRRIVTSAVEHKSVLFPCQKLAAEGFEVMVLPVDDRGIVSLDAAEQVINEDTALVSVQAANNEVGSLQPVAEISEIAHHYGALIHCDAAQAVGKIPLDVHEWGVDLLSLSAHKLYGPKGIGALYVRGGPGALPLEPVYVGGGQERGIRPGTLNVPAIVGFGKACEIALGQVAQEAAYLTTLRDDFERDLLSRVETLRINGDRERRLPNTSSITFPGVDADALLLNVPHLMLGTGSACTSRTIEPSHVLQAMGISRQDASSTIRVSIGRFNTAEELAIAAESLAEAYYRLLQA
jgi:cysteine desulfurase